MEVHQVRYFLALCETLNFTRAAEACHVSQPSLTRAIKMLEDELGGPLFHRERDNTHVTDLGRIMRSYLEDVWSNMSQARELARDFVKLKEAPLTVGVMCTIGPMKLLSLLLAFRRQHPGIRLNLQDDTADGLLKSLTVGDIDIAIFTLKQEDDRLYQQPLYTERFVVAFPPGHRFEKLNAVPLSATDKEDYLQRLNCEFVAEFDALLGEHAARISICYGTERETWIQSMVLAGLGIAFMPESIPTLPGLPTRPMIAPEFKRRIDLVTVRGRPHSPAVGAFVREAMRFRTELAQEK